jgi:hypothetical protein
MLNFRSIALPMVLLLTVVSVASAQRGRGGMVSPIVLASAEGVQAELSLNDDQKQAIDELRESWRSQLREMYQARDDRSFEELTEKRQELSNETDGKLKELLEEEQAKRLGQIFIQVNGAQSVSHPLVAQVLSLSDEQKEQVRAVNRESMEARRKVWQDARDGGSREQMREQMAKLREDANKNLLAKLTDEQKEKLESLKGEAFEFDRSQLRRRR